MAMRRPDFGAEQDDESIFAAEGMASPFIVGGTTTSPFEVATDIGTEAATRRAAAEGMLAQTEEEIRADREQKAEEGQAKEIGAATATGGTAGAIAGSVVPGLGNLVGAIVGAIGGLIGGAVQADVKHGKAAVEEDVEKAVSASGKEVEVAEAEDVEQQAGLAPAGLARAAAAIGQQVSEEPDAPSRRRMRAPTFTV